MRPLRFGVLLLGALTLLLSACSDSEKTLPNIEAARSEIFQLVDGVFGDRFEVDPAECPDEVPMAEGLTFICTVDIDGEPLRIAVTQTNGEGGVRIRRAQSVLETPKVEQFVVSYLDENGEPGSQAICADAALIIRSPGDEVECAVRYADGTTAVAVIGVKDTKGQTALLRITPSN
jgi:hypothetical protein